MLEEIIGVGIHGDEFIARSGDIGAVVAGAAAAFGDALLASGNPCAEFLQWLLQLVEFGLDGFAVRLFREAFELCPEGGDFIFQGGELDGRLFIFRHEAADLVILAVGDDLLHAGGVHLDREPSHSPPRHRPGSGRGSA